MIYRWLWYTDRRPIYQNTHNWQIESWGILTFMYLIGKWFTFVILKCTRRTILELKTHKNQGIVLKLKLSYRETNHYWSRNCIAMHRSSILDFNLLFKIWLPWVVTLSIRFLFNIKPFNSSHVCYGIWHDLHVLMKHLAI